MAKSYKYSRSRKPLDLPTLQLRMTDAFKKLERIIMDDSYNPKEVYAIINACNSLSNLANRYAKVVEVADLKEEVNELKELVETRLNK